MKYKCLIYISIITLAIAGAAPSSAQRGGEQNLYLPSIDNYVREARFVGKTVFDGLPDILSAEEKDVPAGELDGIIRDGVPIRYGTEESGTRRRRLGRDEAKFQRRFISGLKLFRNRDYTKAAEDLVALLTEYPEEPLLPDVMYWLAESHLAAGEWHKARNSFTAAEQYKDQGHFTGYALYSLGWMAYREENYTEAAAYFGDYRKRFPSGERTPQVLFRLGGILLDSGDFLGAVAIFQRLYDGYPEFKYRDLTVFLLAECRFFSENYGQSAVHYKDFYNRLPGNSLADDSLFGAGLSHFRLGNYGAAASFFATLFSDHPESPLAGGALYLAGRSYEEEGRQEQARETYLLAEETYAGSPIMDKAVFSMGMLELNEGLHQQSALTFTRLIEKSPSGPYVHIAYYMKGESYYRAGRYQQAAEVFWQVHDGGAEPALASCALMKSGWCLYLDADYQGAISALRSLILIYPEWPVHDEAVFWLAESYYEINNYSQAVFLYRKLAGGGGDRADDAAYGLALSYYRQGKWAEAADAFRDLLTDHPDTDFVSDALYRLGESLFGSGKPDEALSSLREFLERFPGAPGSDAALYRAGSIQLELGRLEESYFSFLKIETDHPDSSYLPEATYLKALSQFRQGKYMESLENFTAVRNCCRTTRWGRLSAMRIGDAYYALGMYPEAVETYREISLEAEGVDDGQAADGRYGLARALLELDRPDDFQREFAYFEERFPDSPNRPKIIYLAAGLENKAGRTGVSRELYGRILDLFPGDKLADNAALKLAVSLMTEGLYQEASDELEEAIARFGDGDAIDELIYRMGLARRMLKDCDGAAAYFKQYMKKGREGPSFPQVLYHDAMCALEAGDEKRAVAELEELIEKYPENQHFSRACLEMAEIRTRQKDYSSALAVLRKVIEKREDDNAPRAQFQIGRLYRLTGESDRAIIEFLKVPYLYPGRFAIGMEARLEAASIYTRRGEREQALGLLKIILDHPDSGDYRTRADELLNILGGWND